MSQSACQPGWYAAPQHKNNRAAASAAFGPVASSGFAPTLVCSTIRQPSRQTMLHLTKLAVGVRDTDHLRDLQATRMRENPPLRHRTRNFPRRRAEVVDGGSMYWVISGTMMARQRIVDIIEDRRDDMTPCTSFILDPDIVPLAGRPTRPFQGWRYLDPDDAPLDMRAIGTIAGLDSLPAALRLELRTLCLI